MLTIDASKGEGGGQVVRSALALSLATGRAFVLENIRAGKRTPGLGRQHVVAVQAAAQVSGGEHEGAQSGSLRLRFAPRRVQGGTYRFNVASAGSAVLIAQTVIPALLRAGESSEVVVEGGTHNALSPPYEFFDGSYLGFLRKLGADVKSEIWRYGFMPDAGGAFRTLITPRPLSRHELVTRGRLLARRGAAKFAKISRGIADREVAVLEKRFRWGASAYGVDEVEAGGGGNVVVVTLRYTHVTIVMTQLGDRELPAETFTSALADRIDQFLPSDVPVDAFLADQILVPLALAGGGSFRTVEPTAHTMTQIDVLHAFLPEIEVKTQPDGRGAWIVSLAPR